MVVSRNSPVAELNWFCFLLIWIYLNSEEFDCKGGGGSRDTTVSEELVLKNYFFKSISMPDC